ncbi:PREDICTED: uncharacterized protein LOC109187961 isoform X1 [Ipomoea nil]|uniref:uncharacterized protein LOC109187961 isoform X1 n=3 Tax=Ipomoea nil TaxID=35883 RepID=UPI000901E462|nr:PREDICTED: uncharacterized protein LOC109187961 isoform X1 [Ipomoea nil]
MGKRKERRLAAMSASSRRVKLDLFAEPSGDLGGSSQDGVGGDEASKNQAELPNSPSSSGLQQENPLMLLGQYSDDELDEGSSEGPIRAGSEDSSVAHDDQGKVASTEDKNDAKGVIGSDTAKVEDEAKENGSASENFMQRPEEDEHKGNDAIYSVEKLKEKDVMSQNTTLGAFDAQVGGDVISGWKVVFHEESNQYYYWNVSTGETSWEVPSALIPTSELGNEEKATDGVDVEGSMQRTYESHTNLNVKPGDSNPGETGDDSNDNNECKMEMFNDGFKCNAQPEKGVDDDAKLSDTKKMSGQLDSRHDISSPVGCSSKLSGDILLAHLSESCEDVEKHRDVVTAGEFDIEADFSSHLVVYCESLLEKLKVMQGSEKSLQKHDQISKYVLEVDIRLADIRSLACNGLSLLPFWVHSEKQLKLLEAAINEVCEQSNSLRGHDVEALHTSQHEITDDTKVDANEKIAIHHCAAEYTGSPGTRKDAHVEPYHDGASTNSGSNTIEEGEVVELAEHEEFAPKTVLLPAEEVDMDVDMEVEDVGPPCGSKVGDASVGQYHLVPEKDMVPALSANEGSSLPENTSNVPPPPPDEDWVPPPPPDDEPFPPPPPDEPPETTYSQPSDLPSVQPFPYTLSYPVSGYEYYGQINNVPPNSNLYSHAEGQITVSHQQLYYEAVPNLYSSDPMAVNAVNPGAYYGFQGGAAHHVPLVAADSSVLPSGSINGKAISGQIGSFGTLTEVSSVLPIQNTPNGGVDVGSSGVSLGFPSQTSLQGTDTILPPENTLVASTSSATSTATASNVPSKVARKKKGTVAVGSTLRSNKKVSNLVDKWKAAKEELHAEEEEERASAYEILEKKRQREIEEWRAQQIASGEAKDNANFQPLGGDWRERVKRRRAEKMKETEKKPTDGTEENQQPDLNALSIGLPSGWQAYWDESSKQVYYGNAATSETTWTRPTT